MKEQTHISVLSELIDTAEMSSLAATLPTMQRDQQQQLTMADCVLQDQLTSLLTESF